MPTLPSDQDCFGIQLSMIHAPSSLERWLNSWSLPCEQPVPRREIATTT